MSLLPNVFEVCNRGVDGVRHSYFDVGGSQLNVLLVVLSVPTPGTTLCINRQAASIIPNRNSTTSECKTTYLYYYFSASYLFSVSRVTIDFYRQSVSSTQKAGNRFSPIRLCVTANNSSAHWKFTAGKSDASPIQSPRPGLLLRLLLLLQTFLPQRHTGASSKSRFLLRSAGQV